MLTFQENTDGTLKKLTLAPEGRNWVEGTDHRWGEPFVPAGIAVKVSRILTEKGRLREIYSFENVTNHSISLSRAGIFTTFNDNYDSAEIVKREKCHAHLWCGGTSSWVNALSLAGDPPHLGLVLTEGSLSSYQVYRAENSNDRGDLCVLLTPVTLAPKETYQLSWELFEHRDNFFEILKEYPSYLPIEADTFTFFAGETPTVRINGQACPLPDVPGYHTKQVNGAFFRYACLPRFSDLVAARCRFIAAHQQETVGELAGAYLVYDNETNERIYEENPNHNAGRERIGMGLLMARYLQTHDDPVLYASLMRYTDFVLREHFDESTGEVFNELHRDNHRRRIYNNAWYASFFRELYRLTKNVRWLADMVGAFRDLYAHGGERFYPLGIEMTDAVLCLREAGMVQEERELMVYFTKNADYMLAHGTDYPSLEVKYEANIVSPAGMVLLQMFELTNEKRYLAGAKEHLAMHNVFSSFQPDARMHGAEVHHWDDFWFGKRRLYGDTYPHYWITAGCMFHARISADTGSREDLFRARAGLRTAMNLFTPDGRATCAILTPAFVNDIPGDFTDPWANDQDWALYFALQFDERFGL